MRDLVRSIRVETKGRLLWVDGLAGLTVGLAMLALRAHLPSWYQLPAELLLFIAGMNVLYGVASLSLAVRRRRRRSFLVALIVANSAWVIACLTWAWVYGGRASLFGLGHLLGEAIFVGALAVLEWRWRALLSEPSW